VYVSHPRSCIDGFGGREEGLLIDIDVDENIKKVQKQVDAMEEKIAQIYVVSEPDVKNEEGLSVMDIQEELDEEGNIMNAWVNGKDPEAVARTLDPEALLKLEKIVEDVERLEKATDPKVSKVATPKTQENVPLETSTSSQSKVSQPNLTPPKARSPKEPEPTPVRDVASDSEEDKEEEGGGYVRVIDDPEEPNEEDWVKEVPGETEEDRKLRQEMLKYNMSEIGAVVAELNLEDDGDYYGYEDYTDYDEEDDEEYSEEEDEYGRTTRRVVSENYRRQMEELEERLTGKPAGSKQTTAQVKDEKPAVPVSGKKKGVRFSEELDIAPPPPVPQSAPAKLVSAQPDEIDFAPDETDALPFLEKLLERQEITNAGPTQIVPIPAAPAEKPKPKVSLFKKEKMAPSPLRQMETPQGPPKELAKIPLNEVKEKAVPTSTLSESVMERTPDAPTVPVMAPTLPPKKLSRFAAARAAAKAEPAPEPEEPKLMSSTIIERTPSSKAKPPSEFDTDIHRQEVAMQFHKLRSKMIHQQGGFIEQDEDRAIVPLDEDGEKVKVSRFKAASLKGMGNQ
jgi:unconventional prefoldin RPB5 interactor 1